MYTWSTARAGCTATGSSSHVRPGGDGLLPRDIGVADQLYGHGLGLGNRLLLAVYGDPGRVISVHRLAKAERQHDDNDNEEDNNDDQENDDEEMRICLILVPVILSLVMSCFRM